VTPSRAAPPATAPPPETRLPPIRHTGLASGTGVFVVERRELPVVDLRVVVRAGAAADPQGRAGCAGLTAALLDQGTTSRSAFDIAEQAELLGASLQTRATWDACVVALHVLTSRLEPAVELLADVVTRAALPPDELERRRRSRLAAILQEHDEPRVVASHAFSRAVYSADHRYGLPLGGNAESVAALDRDEIVEFYQARFRPGNAFIVAVGDIDADTLSAMLEAAFGEWHGTAAAAVTMPPAAVAPPRQGRAIQVVHRAGAPQSELRVGIAGPARTTPDYFSLLVGNTVLGGAFTSRLNILLRQEKAYTYGAGSSFAFRRDGGPFLASTAVSTAATADAVNDMVREVARLSSEPVPELELERARSYIMLGLPRTFETTGDIAEHVTDVPLYDLDVEYYDRYAASVRAVDAAAVQAAAARWLHADALSITVVGDADVVVPELEDLGIGAVNVRDER
jgi:zinc protease